MAGVPSSPEDAHGTPVGLSLKPGTQRVDQTHSFMRCVLSTYGVPGGSQQLTKQAEPLLSGSLHSRVRVNLKDM